MLMQMTELALQTQHNNLIDEVKQFIFKWFGENKISDTQMAMALKLCQEYDLSPLRREIHFLPFWNSQLQRSDLQPVIAYTEYIKKAQNTGKLNGYQYTLNNDNNGNLESCTVTIHRKDWDHPFSHTVYLSEVIQKNKEGKPNSNWLNKPKFMIMKVAIAQSMRLAFPEDLWAMPYEESEAWNVIDKKEWPQYTMWQIADIWRDRMWDDNRSLLSNYVLKTYGVVSREMTEDQINELGSVIESTINLDELMMSNNENTFISVTTTKDETVWTN